MTGATFAEGPLRILHVIRSSQFAGVEQFVRRLAIAQSVAGHSVAVVGGEERRMRDSLRAVGVGFRPVRQIGAVAAAVRSNAHCVDVINSHMTAADIGAVVGRGLTRADPTIVSTRHFAQPRGSTGPRWMYRKLERSIDAELSISASVAAAVGVPSTIVHPGVDRRDAPAEETRGRKVLIAQRLEAEKHTDVGIRAFVASGLAHSGWVLEIAGAGAEAYALEVLTSSLGVSHCVRFLGFRDDVPTLMDRAGLFLATCPYEHFGLSVLESMSSGLPVVAAQAAGHVEMLVGLDPRALFGPDDVATAAHSLRSLAEDDAGRRRLGRAEQDRQRARFSLDSQVRQTDAAYRIAIASRGGSAHRERGRP